MAVTLRQLLNLEYKTNSLTMAELKAACILALTLQPVKNNQALYASITTLLLSITAYETVITVVDTIQKARPAINIATKAGASVMNPSIAPEIAQDAVLIVQPTLITQAKNAVKTAQNAILDTPVA